MNSAHRKQHINVMTRAMVLHFVTQTSFKSLYITRLCINIYMNLHFEVIQY